MRKIILAGLIIIGVIIGMSTCSEKKSNTQTVDAFRQSVTQQFNNELQNPSNPVRKRVENAHLSVTITSAYVESCKIHTIDGSNNAGTHGSNVQHIEIRIRTEWDGFFHKNGHTVCNMTYQVENAKLKLTSANIVETDAKINIEDPKFWWNVGYTIGVLIAL